jgi:hypothetical protein
MNVFIFNDLNLKTGILITNGSLKKFSINEFTTTENTLFVLPNELIQFIEFKHNLKNKQNIHASIINNSSSLNINDIDQLVLDTSNSNNFFITSKHHVETIKKVFKNFNTTISITSDLLFFKEAFKKNCTYQNNIYLIDAEEGVKLSAKSFNLLDEAISVKKISDSDLKELKNINFVTHKLNTFNVSSIFDVKNFMKSAMTMVIIICIFYITAFFNISSNYSQMKNMTITLEAIYSDIYPSEEISDISQQIDAKLNSLNNEKITNLSKTINLLRQISESVNIVKADYSQDELLITCLFKNDAEESIFVNQQNRLNKTFTIIDSKAIQLGKVTTISYEL